MEDHTVLDTANAIISFMLVPFPCQQKIMINFSYFFHLLPPSTSPRIKSYAAHLALNVLLRTPYEAIIIEEEPAFLTT